MKKIYINTLPEEKRNYLIKLNKKLMDQLQADLYDVQMDQQLETFNDALDEESRKAIDYHDYYSSFYYILNDWRKFIDGVHSDYLSPEGIDVYNKIIENIKKLDVLDYGSEEYWELDEQLEKDSKIILKDIEDLLHSYEDYPSEDDAIQYADEMERLNDYYIEEREDGTSDNVIRLDIAYTETFI